MTMLSTTATCAKLTAEDFLELVQRPENANKWLELDRSIDLNQPALIGVGRR